MITKKSVILVGGGTSVTEGIEKDLWNKIKDKTIWSLNYGFMTMPYLPQREVWVDGSFFKNNMIALNDLANKDVDMVAKHNSFIGNLPKLTSYESTRNRLEYVGKLGKEKNRIFCGHQGFVGTFALHLAICDGFNEIFLLGYDYGVPPDKKDKTETHYYQNKLKVISSGFKRPQIYLDQNNKVKLDVEDYKVFLQEKDVKIWNVSVNSNISYFEKITWKVFFEKIKNEKNL